MLRSIKDPHGCTVSAFDGDIGAVDQVYFDDHAWGVRYLVVETGNWLNDRRVLISVRYRPSTFSSADDRNKFRPRSVFI